MIRSTKRPPAPRWLKYNISAACIILLTSLVAGSSSIATVAAAIPASAPQPVAPQATNMQYGAFMAGKDNYQEIRAMGFQWVQQGIYWRDAEPQRGGPYNWGNLDNIVNNARDNQLNVLIRVSRSPEWARDPNCSASTQNLDTCPPRDPADLGRFMYQVAAEARRLTPYTVAFEIWNEPNTSQEWGDMCPQADKYAAMLRAAYPQVKAADPSALVLGGSVTTVGERLRPNECHVDDIAYLEAMYQAGAKGYFDILADHPYGFGSAPETSPSNKLVFRRAERHRDIMVQYGDSAKKIWATEMGWPVDPRTEGSSCARPDWYFIYTPQQQADYLVRAFNYARSYWPWMTGMFIFNYDFNYAYSDCQPFRFWAIRGRPAQTILSGFVHNPPPTYTPVPATPPAMQDQPPAISAVRYSATEFTRTGGDLIIEVDASDGDSSPIDVVQANVTFPDGTYQLFNFTLVAGTAQSGTWRASVPVAVNNTGNTQSYSVSPFVVETYPTRRTVNAASQQIVAIPSRFLDVPPDFWAYTYIDALAGSGVISGYSDMTFRPGSSTTRAQLTKITMLGFNYPLTSGGKQTFADVPADSPFYSYIQTAAGKNIISGYPCGHPDEPCDDQSRPYFRPNNSITRGQITKIIVLAAGWNGTAPASNTFADVLPESPFYPFVEAAAAHGIIGGYSCAGPGEPCDDQSRPYFRPNNTTTRAQITKMVYLALQQPAPTATPSATATNTPLPPTATLTYTSTSTVGSTSTTTRTATSIPTAGAEP